MRALLAHTRPQATALAVACVLSAAAALMTLAQPLAVKRVFHDLSASRPVAGPLALIVGLFLAEALTEAVRNCLLGRIGEGVVLRLRTLLVARLLRWPTAAHERHRSGDLISRLSGDTTAVRWALTGGTTDAVAGVLTFVGALVLMAALDPLMLAVTLCCLAVAAAAVAAVPVRLAGAAAEARRSLGRLSAGLERVLRAVRTVKLSGAEEREEARLVAEARAAYRAELRQVHLRAVVRPVVTLAVQGSLVVVLCVGGVRVAEGTMGIGDLIAFLMYLMCLAVPVGTVSGAVAEVQAGRAALARVEELLREPLEAEPPAHDRDVPGRIPEPRGPVGTARGTAPAVELREVDFAYPGRDGSPALRRVSLEVPEGGRVALVGPSGAGKSTVLALIGRIYRPESGTLRLFGRDAADLSLEALRALIGHVEQEAPVMAGTLRSNLVYARPDVSERRIKEVLDRTNLAGFVDSLPEGLDTQVGDGGVLLSGGQRQRVAIARMLLKEPRLLLLDEVTSQMDGENERLLNATLREAADTCTVLVVAHRLSTVQDADRILVMDAGRIRARGTHHSLLREDELYAHLARTQLLPTSTG